MPKFIVCDHSRDKIDWLSTPHAEEDGDGVQWPGMCECGLAVYDLYESKGIYNGNTDKYIEE